MQLTTHLNKREIEEALRRYVAYELGIEVKPDDVVNIHAHHVCGEYYHVSVTVEYTK